jgi:hypothetical protein
LSRHCLSFRQGVDRCLELELLSFIASLLISLGETNAARLADKVLQDRPIFRGLEGMAEGHRLQAVRAARNHRDRIPASSD